MTQTKEEQTLLEDLFEAYYDARRSKRNSISALAFEVEYEQNLLQLYQEITSRTYKPSPYSAFIVDSPVKREVFASNFRDRVVHHLLYNYLNPLFDPTFIHDSYSCRTDKGTSYGIKRVGHFIRSCTQNYKENAYVLKIDIKSYFMSIDRTILYDMIHRALVARRNKIACELELVLYLLENVLFFDPTRDYVLKSPREAWVGLPRSKSLFYTPKNKGLPIGNLTSQLFANIYLNSLDQYAKRILSVRYYGRYVDDIVIVDRDKVHLQRLMENIKEYLKVNLDLELHPNKIYLQEARKGVEFLGMIIKPYRTLVGKRIRSNFKRCLDDGKRQYNYNTSADKDNRELLALFLQKLSQQVNSYLGLLRQAKSYRMRCELGHTITSHFEGALIVSDDFTKLSIGPSLRGNTESHKTKT